MVIDGIKDFPLWTSVQLIVRKLHISGDQYWADGRLELDRQPGQRV